VPAVVSQCNKHRALSTWRPKPLLCPNDNSFLVLLDRYNVMLFSRWHVSVQMLVVNASAAVPKWQQRPCTLTTWYRYNVALTTAMLCSNVCVTPLLCLRQRQDTVTKLCQPFITVYYRCATVSLALPLPGRAGRRGDAFSLSIGLSLWGLPISALLFVKTSVHTCVCIV
jgi:hypothetical protein